MATLHFAHMHRSVTIPTHLSALLCALLGTLSPSSPASARDDQEWSIVRRLRTVTETYNTCDSLVLQQSFRSNVISNVCRDADPPLGIGNCTACRDYWVSSDHVGFHLVRHSERGTAHDRNGYLAVVRGETFSVAAYVFAKSGETLENVLDNMSLDARVGTSWQTRDQIDASDHTPVTNLRHYTSAPCHALSVRVGNSWEAFARLSMFAGAARSVGRPFPPRDPTGTPRPDDPRAKYELSDREMEDMLESSWQDFEDTLEDFGAAHRDTCPDKVLPYYWTKIYLTYTPEASDGGLRLHVTSSLSGPQDIAVTTFRVYSAVAGPLALSDAPGNRNFSFSVFTAADVGQQALDVSMSYNRGTYAHNHVASVTLEQEADADEIAGHTVVARRATGHFPFRRTYWDSDLYEEVTEIVSDPGDSDPVAIPHGKSIEYRTHALVAGAGFESRTATLKLPRPLVFAILGDSFAAGQGAPLLGTGVDPWIHKRCHRSRNSGMYLAVNRFIKESTKACVSSVSGFVACDGAILEDVLDQAQEDDAGVARQDAQIDIVREWMEDKGYSAVDAALVNIGGNNCQFAPYIITAFLYEPVGTGYEAVEHVYEEVEEGLDYLSGPEGYTRLDRVLREDLHVSEVLMNGYPDLSHHPTGTICATDCPATALNAIEREEIVAANDILFRINDVIREAAGRLDWHYIDIYENTSGHGMCDCEDPYYTSWRRATGELKNVCHLGRGVEIHGMTCAFHPNEKGHAAYVPPLLDALTRLFGD